MGTACIMEFRNQKRNGYNELSRVRARDQNTEAANWFSICLIARFHEASVAVVEA